VNRWLPVEDSITLQAMDAYLSRNPRKRPRDPTPPVSRATLAENNHSNEGDDDGEDSTDLKLAMLSSLFPNIEQNTLLDVLIASDGSVEAACTTLSLPTPPQKKRAAVDPSLAIQSSLSSYTGLSGTNDKDSSTRSSTGIKPLTKKGKTLHLFSPEDIALYTPCSVIHNFLPKAEADNLLRELLEEAKTFKRQTFQLFDNVVQSPHSVGFYVSNAQEQKEQKSEYTYNGSYRTDVRQITPGLREVSTKVKEAVNDQIQNRIASHYPDGKKLKFQSPREWIPNAAFVNCYDGPAESVGYHSDELTYLGPRATIGSLSLGVAREFRVRRVIPSDDDCDSEDEDNYNHKGNDRDLKLSSKDTARADAQGQISIHLPHNSLLVMHAETQEEWKHCVAPAQTISPHSISGNKRINITYRWYRDSLHPRNTPRCRCRMPAVLRCVQRKKETHGQYMWMCYAGYAPGKKSCSFFEWAKFDDDGEPIWNQSERKHRAI
jgi:alkylated DNA repair dioxygenase AlkB